jgi:hypothetical protein
MLSIQDEVTMVEILAILIGFGITWAVYFNSDHAELPGEAIEPDPNVPPETVPHPGRTLE